MRKYIFILIAGLLFCSCEEFLEEKSQDLIVPDNVQDIDELIFGDLVNRGIGNLLMFDVMSDDVTSQWNATANGTDFRNSLYQYFTWQNDLEMSHNGEEIADRFYGQLYADIVLCNSIENILPDLDGTNSEKLNALAETYFFRAWSYFDLSNIYSTPYVDEESSKTTLCVPINNGEGVGAGTFLRSTQREVFDIIEKDITKAVEYFEKSNELTSIYRPNLKAALILATRIFLYEKKYDKVVEYANKIEGIDDLYSMKDYVDSYGVITDLSNSEDYSATTHVHFINESNQEIAFTFQDSYDLAQLFPTSKPKGMYFPSNDLLNLYEEEDLRRKVFFDETGFVTKQAESVRSVKQTNLKTTEALLNRAEAYAHLDEIKAKDDLMVLRLKRFPSSTLIPEIAGDILEAVKLERRRELCFEGIRWMDLRRWGMPEIKHEFFLEDNARMEVYTLEEGDAGYTFSLPRSLTLLNSEITQHIRPERNPTIVDL